MDKNKNPEVGGILVPQLRLIKGGIDTTEPLKPYLGRHHYQYDCTFLDHPVLHKSIAEDIAYTIALRLGKLKKGRSQNSHGQYPQIKKFLFWILNYLAHSDKPFTRSVKQRLAAGEAPERESWQLVVNEFRKTVVRSKDNPITNGTKLTRNSYIDVIRVFLDVCASRGVFPPAVLRGIKNAHKDKKGRRILGDLPSRKFDKDEVERMLGGFLQDRVNNNDIIEEEREACITALASSGLDITGMNDDQIIDEVKRFNAERLVEVRRCAETEFIKAWDVYQEGQQLLAECDLSYEEDMLGLVEGWFQIRKDDQTGKSPETRQNPFRVLFLGHYEKDKPKGRWSRSTGRYANQLLPERVAKSRLLTLLDGRYGHGPHIREKKFGKGVVEDPIAVILHNTFRVYGQGDYKSWIKKSLGASLYTLLMAQIILLVDTGLNTEVIDELTVDCVRDTDIPTIKEIWGIKSRASNQPVVGRVRLNVAGHRINSIEVIQRVKEMTRRFRHIAKSGHSLFEVRAKEPRLEEKLFIREEINGKRVNRNGNLDLAAGASAFSEKPIAKFREKHPTVGTYNFTMSSIRPTVRILAFMDGEDIDISSAQMCHANVRTTSGYVMRTMSRMQMEGRIREFMKHYEAIVIQDISGAAEKLGYSAEEYENRLIAAQRTGLGTICDHLRKDSEGNEFSLKQKECDPVEDCLDCPLARVFPAFKENLVDAFLMRGWIRSNEVDLRANEERWRNVWMRWLAIVEGVIDKAKTAHSVSRKILREAEDIAEKLGKASFLPLV